MRLESRRRQLAKRSLADNAQTCAGTYHGPTLLFDSVSNKDEPLLAGGGGGLDAMFV